MPFTRRVLFVEDDIEYAQAVKHWISGASGGTVQTVHVEQLDEALALLESESFDAMLLDLFLPDGEVSHTLFGAHPLRLSLPIILLTGKRDARCAALARDRGFENYLIKSETSPQNLWATVHRSWNH